MLPNYLIGLGCGQNLEILSGSAFKYNHLERYHIALAFLFPKNHGSRFLDITLLYANKLRAFLVALNRRCHCTGIIAAWMLAVDL